MAFQPLHESREARRRVGRLQPLARRRQGHIERRLRHVDPGRLHAILTAFHGPTLVASDLKVPATIRAMTRLRRPSSPTVLVAPVTNGPPPAARLVRLTPSGRPGERLHLSKPQSNKVARRAGGGFRSEADEARPSPTF